MEKKKINWHEQIGGWALAIGLTFLIGYLVYDYNYHYKEVCQTYRARILKKVHEVESINNFGATRNNYYLYLDNSIREEIDLDTYTLSMEGTIYEFTKCRLEPIK